MALIFAGTGTDPGTIQLSQPITPGIVVAATVHTSKSITEAYSLWATIGIGEFQAGALVITRIQLAEGYIHRLRSISWTGFYPLEPNDHLYLTLTGDLTATVEAHLRRLPNITVQLIKQLLDVQQPTN